MKLSEIIKDTNKIKSRIGFDENNNMVVTDEPNILAGQGFQVYELNDASYKKLLEILKSKDFSTDGLDMLYQLIPFITDIEVDMTINEFQIGVAMGNATTYEFINIIAQVYKDIEKFSKLYNSMDETIEGVNKLTESLKVNVREFTK